MTEAQDVRLKVEGRMLRTEAAEVKICHAKCATDQYKTLRTKVSKTEIDGKRGPTNRYLGCLCHSCNFLRPENKFHFFRSDEAQTSTKLTRYEGNTHKSPT